MSDIQPLQPYRHSSASVKKKSGWSYAWMFKDQSLMYVLLLLGGWFFLSYSSITLFTNRRSTAELAQRITELEQAADAVSYNFERSLSFLNVIPATVADNISIIDTLRSLNKQADWKNEPPPAKRTFLDSRRDVTALELHLLSRKEDLGVDVIWVMSREGDCIASSNFNQPESFVGISYADRAYFKSTLAGLRGKQYAVGRQTNIPGLFFSAPIYDRGSVVGAVAVKIDIAKLSQWFNRFDFFVTDTEGVVFLSSNKKLEHYALANAPVFRLNPEDQDKKYKRRDFPTLKISTNDHHYSSYPVLTLPGSNSSYILAKGRPGRDGYTVFTYVKAAEPRQLRTLKWQLTLLVFSAGAGLIMIIAGTRRYLRDMRKALIAAEAASHAKGTFLANMSHEIRTPMNGIIGMTELCLRTSLDAKQQQYLNAVKVSADNLLTIINDILDFSKIEEGKIELSRTPFILRLTVEQAMQSVAMQAAEKMVELIYRPSPDIPEALRGDPGRLRQILINLVGNAVKFTDSGRVLVSVSVVEFSENICLLSFSVEDEGIGISAEKLDKIFIPFEQGDLSTTKAYGGTGLGLTITKNFVELMGGSISVKSELGKGSTFTFTIPFEIVTTPESLADLESSEYMSVSDTDSQDNGKLDILVAEDVSINQLLIETILSRHGHTVTLVDNGEQAVQAWQSKNSSFDIIFMDVQMPVMDGLQATCRIRELENERGGHIPVIAMTAYAMKEDMDRCREAGMDDYISKPFHYEDLLTVIKNVIRNGSDPVAMTVPASQARQVAGEKTVPVFAKEELIQRLGGKEESLPRFLALFEKNCIGYLDALRQAVQSGNCEQVRIQAHMIKGVAANISAHKMKETASLLEDMAREGRQEGWEDYMMRLEAEFKEFTDVTAASQG